MDNKKLKLDQLRVKTFVTKTPEQIKGGNITVFTCYHSCGLNCFSHVLLAC